MDIAEMRRMPGLKRHGRVGIDPVRALGESEDTVHRNAKADAYRGCAVAGVRAHVVQWMKIVGDRR